MTAPQHVAQNGNRVTYQPDVSPAVTYHPSSIITLPFPPSVNRYWRHNQGRTHISAEGKAYRKAIVEALRGHPSYGTARLALHISAFPPDRRRRDLDNLFKALLDALAHAGLYEDDAQIDELSIRRCALHPGGQLVVRCEQVVP